MIPARLKLENFMCFSDIEVDFSSMKVACLVGNNGSGKSSLLDAITWAIWEKARASNDKLLKIGTQKMSVELETIVDGQLYKIIRYFKKGNIRNPKNKPKTVLELYVYDDNKSLWKPVSEKNLDLTQEKLTNILKLDYDSFVNSVYIRQDNVNTFISKPPEERKRFLGDILGLNQYNNLYILAKQKTEDLEIKAKLIKEQINAGEIKQFSLKKLKNEKELLLSKINTVQDHLNILLREKKELDSKNNQYKLFNEQEKFFINIKQKYEEDVVKLKENIEDVKESLDHFKEVLSIENVIKQQFEELNQLKDEVKTLNIKEMEYHKLKDRLVELGSKKVLSRFGAEQEFNRICFSLDEKQRELDYCRRIIANSAEINNKYNEYQKIKARLDNLKNIKIELSQIELEMVKLQNKIDQQTLEYHNRIELLQSYIKEIEENISNKDIIIEKIAFIESEIKQYDKYEAELERIREKGIDQRDVIIEKNNKNAFLEIEVDKLKARIKQLQNANSKADCPLCSNKIVNTEDIIRKMEFEIDNLMIQMEGNNNDISIADDEIKFLRIAYKEKKKYLNKRSALIFDLAELKTDFNNIELEEQQLEDYKTEMNDLQNKIADKSYAKEERYQSDILQQKKQELLLELENIETIKNDFLNFNSVDKAYKELNEAKEKAATIEAEMPYFTVSKRALEKELQNNDSEHKDTLNEDVYLKLMELNYDINRHFQLRETISNSQQVEYDYYNLQLAYQQLPHLEKNLNNLTKTYNKITDKLEEVKENIENVNRQMLDSYDFNKHYEEINSNSQATTAELNNLNCQLAVVNDRIKSVEEVLAGIKEKRKELDKINKDIIDYIELANAFGEKGMQDVIIENTIPELELETNKILNKLTDNQMTVYLKTSKKNKTGDVNDWLDIYISDNNVTKSYELYSGGEAFRINFALRIALSKLLAKSRGVALQTLIIDEGFGTQDLEGQEKLYSLIDLIKDEFSMILVVSHVNNFAEMFPGKIVLSKQAGSSSARVVA